MSGPLVDPDTVPGWLVPLVRATIGLRADDLERRPVPPAPDDARPAAVLVLFGLEDPEAGPDVLLQRRADEMSSHAGQVSFPGGSQDPGDDGPVSAALREAAEEVGVRPEGVRPVATLPQLYLPPSNFLVTPVLAHWERPGPVTPVDPAETAAVARVPLATLADPGNRFRVWHPSGYLGPAFAVPGMLVWGFTAALVDGLLAFGGWARDWDHADVRDLDDAWRVALTDASGGPDPARCSPAVRPDSGSEETA